MENLEIIECSSKEHWLELRTKDVTSTESAALFGLLPRLTELELFYQKKSGEIIKKQENFRMKLGRILEAPIAELFADEMKCDVEPFKQYYRDTKSKMGSSFDYKITSGKYKGWILEIKNVDYLVYKQNWLDTEAPEHIETQVQHQLELTQAPGAIIACKVGDNCLKTIIRERDAQVGAAIRKRIERFWEDVENDKEPDHDYMRDSDFIISLHQSANDKVYDASNEDHVDDLLSRYLSLKNEAKSLEDRAKAAKAELLEIIDDANKVISSNYILNCGMTKDTPAKPITEEMIGKMIGGRKGFRNFKVRGKKK